MNLQRFLQFSKDKKELPFKTNYIYYLYCFLCMNKWINWCVQRLYSPVTLFSTYLYGKKWIKLDWNDKSINFLKYLVNTLSSRFFCLVIFDQNIPFSSVSNINFIILWFIRSKLIISSYISTVPCWLPEHYGQLWDNQHGITVRGFNFKNRWYKVVIAYGLDSTQLNFFYRVESRFSEISREF